MSATAPLFPAGGLFGISHDGTNLGAILQQVIGNGGTDLACHSGYSKHGATPLFGLAHYAAALFLTEVRLRHMIDDTKAAISTRSAKPVSAMSRADSCFRP